MGRLAFVLLCIVSFRAMCCVGAVTSPDMRYGAYKRATDGPRRLASRGHLVVCARSCLDDVTCVAFRSNNRCTLLSETPRTMTSVWTRVSRTDSGTSSEPAQSLPPEHCRIPPKTLRDIGSLSTALFLLARNQSRTLTLLDSRTGRIQTWTPDIPHSGNAFKGDIAGIETDVSSDEIFVYFNNKFAIYRGRFFQGHMETMKTRARATIGGFAVYKDWAFMTEGRMLERMDLADRKYGVMSMDFTDANYVPVYHDIVDGKCIVFWPEKQKNLIHRVNCNGGKRMRPLSASHRGNTATLSCMTIDVDHIIYVMSTGGALCRLTNIASEYQRRRPSLVFQMRWPMVPGMTLMYHGNRVYIFTPNKKSLDAMDIKINVFIRDVVSGECLDGPPTAITAVK